ncbi:DUF1830 domain-containing protein [Phormidium sp. CLA17]|uniref:DUF1830 domain-containing protein n=1 Tax=Leptolyngbya sp. Cla-17 TaxID=2803751 RepID=UPI0014918AEE|nr:DUF1830 domain-containing protein [Leptolyngbya sp. Cla-17]MBM0742614.1 DUF1830 domain-containing protein [Leptolyngbya sp. Cla-17]
MAQIFDPLPSDQRSAITCCYVNATSRMQIARITNIPSWYFERVVFPGQRLIFETMPESLLEIHSGAMASSILADTIPCERLQIADEIISSSAPEHEQRLEELNDGLGSPNPLITRSTSITP